MEANINVIWNDLRPRADLNKDGELNRSEIATAALIAKDGSAEQQALATMVLGGKDGNGLFPDNLGLSEPNGSISEIELKELAQHGYGDTSAIDPTDFMGIFPEEFNGTETSFGTQYNTDRLQNIAGQEGVVQAFFSEMESLVMNFFFSVLKIDL
ncbi:MAG: hypothetical protein AAGI66_06845 [Cyanobacteria bacterium P01_H01_bin.74]